MLFIDSTCAKHKFMLPPSAFSVGSQDRIQLTLQSFSMRRNFYSIHRYNSLFYLTIANDVIPIQIPFGSYETFDKLAAQIQATLQTSLDANASVTAAQCNCIFDANSRKFKIDIEMTAAGIDISFAAYDLNGSAPPVGVSVDGTDQQVYEILGGKPTRDTARELFNVTQVAAAADLTQKFESFFPAALSTNSALYLRLPTLETGNFSTSSYQLNSTEHNRILESNLFARIPFSSSSYDQEHEFILYEDNGNDAFSATPIRKHLEQLQLELTDAHGRLIDEVHNGQSEAGLLSFRCVLRFDVFKGQEKLQSIERLHTTNQIQNTGHIPQRVVKMDVNC